MAALFTNAGPLTALKPVPYLLESDPTRAAIGIDIGGTNHTAALVSARGEPLEILRGHTDRAGGPEALLDSLGQLLPELLADARERELTLAGVGVGFGGPVDYPTQRVTLSHHVAGWEGFPLAERIEAMSGMPTLLDNDANAGGWGEFVFGAGRGYRDLIYYNIGTGVGGAVILDGRLRRGVSSMAGELGHTTVDPSGPICTCGMNGCLEALASGSAIARMMEKEELIWDDRLAVADDLFPMVAAGQSHAADILGRVVEALALSIRNVIHTLSPDVVILGGGVSRGGEALLSPLRTRLQELVLPAAYRTCDVAQAALGYEAGVIGAAALALSGDAPGG